MKLKEINISGTGLSSSESFFKSLKRVIWFSCKLQDIKHEQNKTNRKQVKKQQDNKRISFQMIIIH